MQKDIILILKKSSLFKNMSEEDILDLLKDPYSEIKEVQKGVRIFDETDFPQKIYILLSGCVIIAKDTLAGKRILLTRIEQPGELFGEIYAFIEKSSYDMYAQAAERSLIFIIDNHIFLEHRQDSTKLARALRNNLLTVFANKAYSMNRKLRVLGSSSIREKIVRFLLERQDKNGTVAGTFSREEMADYLNVTRPSLSRELGKMQKEGILKLKQHQIQIADQEKFESYL